MSTTKKQIEFQVSFDEKLIPEKIVWQANEDVPESVEMKSLFIAGWDEEHQTTATFNIWTKELRVDEMQQLFIQTLMTMASGFERATGDEKIVKQMKEFCESLSEKKK